MTAMPIQPDVRPETMSRLIREGVRLLSDAGVENAENEAAWLVEFTFGASRLELHVDAQRVVSSSDRLRAMALLQRRAAREPLQYILGTQEFCGLDVEVGPQVLIPRPETELLVEEVVRRFAAHSSPLIADVGTGSGCIAVALAKHLPHARLYAVDLSEPALELAQRNAMRHAVHDRMTFLQGNFLEPLERLGLRGRLAAVVSNPPYIPDGDFPALPPEVRDYEPGLALSGGPDGLTTYRTLLYDALEYVAPGGVVILEMGHGQAEHVRRIALEQNGYGAIRVLRDHAGIERVIGLEKSTGGMHEF
ncbi:MAG: peptide chain release factor N(5)-glutamine methyltransferase [Nitrospiraceae bacterium]